MPKRNRSGYFIQETGRALTLRKCDGFCKENTVLECFLPESMTTITLEELILGFQIDAQSSFGRYANHMPTIWQICQTAVNHIKITLKHEEEPFAKTVTHTLAETLHFSLNTMLTRL